MTAAADGAGAAPFKIELRDTTKDFEVRGTTVRALARTSIGIERGAFVSLIGPSGCGKSTVLNMIAGLMSPTSGEVLFDGRPVAGPNRRAGYMTQKDTLLPWRNVADNIATALTLKCRSVGRGEQRDRVRQMTELVGLTGFERHFPSELSGGMRRRVALARMLIYEPETLLLDEPFGALDAQLKLVMHAELLRLTSSADVTVVFVTHDLSEAITLSDRVCVFTSRPGQIRAVRDVPLPRPRDVVRSRFTPQFAELHEALWDELKDEVGKGAEI